MSPDTLVLMPKKRRRVYDGTAITVITNNLIMEYTQKQAKLFALNINILIYSKGSGFAQAEFQVTK